MSEYTVIADVGESLIRLLHLNMDDLVNPSSIVLLSPAEVEGQDVRLTLFLYNVTENPYLKNQETQQEAPGQLLSSALHLYLYYMLTTYASNQITDRTERTLEEHRILGRAMRVLHDNAVLKGSVLQGSLAGSSDEFRICLHPMSLEDQNRIWSAFPNRSFRASIGYLVSALSLDSTRTTEARRVLMRDL